MGRLEVRPAIAEACNGADLSGAASDGRDGGAEHPQARLRRAEYRGVNALGTDNTQRKVTCSCKGVKLDDKTPVGMSQPEGCLRVGRAGRYPANLLHDGSPEVLAAFAAFDTHSAGAPWPAESFPTGAIRSMAISVAEWVVRDMATPAPQRASSTTPVRHRRGERTRI